LISNKVEFDGAFEAASNIFECSDGSNLNVPKRHFQKETWATKGSELLSTNNRFLNYLDKASSNSSTLSQTLKSLGKSQGSSYQKSLLDENSPTKIITILPASVPAYMPDYLENYKNYFEFFKKFDDRYFSKKGGQKRGTKSYWFMKQDRSGIKNYMNRNFINGDELKEGGHTWSSLEKFMTYISPTYRQPKVLDTFTEIFQEFKSKPLEKTENCVIFWFHHYLPHDLIQLNKKSNQEEIIMPLEKMCTIIHFWVGLEENLNDQESMTVVKYLQGIFQPSQIKRTTLDPNLRDWYYIKNLKELSNDENENLIRKVYNSLFLEKENSKCLVASKAVDFPYSIVDFNSKHNENNNYNHDFSGYFDWEVMTTTEKSPIFDANNANFNIDIKALNEALKWEFSAEPDYACCGVGFAAVKYDSLVRKCCLDGRVIEIGYDC